MPAPYRPRQAAPPPPRVLVVEDNPDGRASLALLLELWGCDVAAAADGLAGVETALAWRPELAVVDLGLPELDGYQVARLVRAGLGRSVRLAALTACPSPRDRDRALLEGFDDFLAKPADPEDLARLLRPA